MASEKNLVRALDLLTIAPQGEIESLTVGAQSHVSKMRRVVDTDNDYAPRSSGLQVRDDLICFSLGKRANKNRQAFAKPFIQCFKPKGLVNSVGAY